MAELIAAHDWASTPLGPLDAWSVALKTTTSIILKSSLPMTLLVGEDAITLYNDAHAVLIDQRHPGCLGSRGREVWPEHAVLIDRAMEAAQRGEGLTFREHEVTTLRDSVQGQAWLNIDFSPACDENGVFFGVMSVMVEMTERVLAERKAALQLDRLRSMFDQAPGFICLLGPDLVVEYDNETHKRIFGDRNAQGRRFPDAFPDLFANGAGDLLLEVYASGQRHLARGSTMRLPRPGGGWEERFADLVIEPLKDDAGKVNGVFVEGFDVTPLVVAQRAVEAAAQRLSAAATLARLGTFELVPETGEAKLDERAREIYGFRPDERVTTEDVVSRIEGEDRARLAVEDAAEFAAGRTRRETEYRIRLPDDSVRHVRAIGDLIMGRDGSPAWSIGMCEDVTERRRAEQRQWMLINELNHRVKNTLATVQSIASQTLRCAPDLPQASGAFEARLMALSAAHNLLTAQSWCGARLDEVARHALAPFEAVPKPQIARSGPNVWLTAHSALALSLALHELATNATKYGALAVPEGRVSVHWKLCAGELALAWIEQGGPTVAPPSHLGFGTRLVQRKLARELGGDVALDFAPEGVRCEIRFPIEIREPEAESRATAASSEPPGRFWLPDLDASLAKLIHG